MSSQADQLSNALGKKKERLKSEKLHYNDENFAMSRSNTESAEIAGGVKVRFEVPRVYSRSNESQYRAALPAHNAIPGNRLIKQKLGNS